MFDEGVNKGTATAGINVVGPNISGTVTSGTAILTLGTAIGYEYDYVQVTASFTTTATTEGTSGTVVQGGTVTYNGTDVVMLHFWAGNGRPGTSAANQNLVISLRDNGTATALLSTITTPAAGGNNVPINDFYRMTPTAGTHAYSIQAYVSAGTGLVSAGAAGAGTASPAFLRITKVS